VWACGFAGEDANVTKVAATNGSASADESWRPTRSPEELAARLRAVGQRVTPQRLLILNAFARPGEHLTADEVYARVGPLAPAVNRSTLYRTLDDGRHHHLICRDCGGMLVLDDDLIAPLRDGIRNRYGFNPAIDHLALFGLCRECQVDAAESGATRTKP
jgi:Fur family ferric uptake transcriptional regulator